MDNATSTTTTASDLSDNLSLDGRKTGSGEPRSPSTASEAAASDHGDTDKDTVSIFDETTAAAEKETINIAPTYNGIKVTWNENNQTEEARDITCRFNINHMNNTALLRLQSHTSVKNARGKNSRIPVYIYIYPENVKTITVLDEGLFSSKDASGNSTKDWLKNTYFKLRICLMQAPDLIRPKDYIFESRNKTKDELDVFRALANATEFIIHLDCFRQNMQRSHIGLLVDAFSEGNKDRPRTDDRHANLNMLYGGKGGEVATESKAEALVADTPPVYIDSTPTGGQNSKKRQRTDAADALEQGRTDTEDASDDENHTDHAPKEKRQRTGADESFGARLLSILEDTNRCVRKMEKHMSEMGTRMSNMEKRISKVETRLVSIDNRIFALEMTGDKLETHFEDADERFNDLENQLRSIDYRLDLTKDRVDDVKRKIDRKRLTGTRDDGTFCTLDWDSRWPT